MGNAVAIGAGGKGGNLHKKTITDKNGKKTTVWVKDGEVVKSPKGKKQEDAPADKKPKAEDSAKDLKHFEEIASKAKDAKDFIAKVREINDVPKSVADAFAKKYGGEGVSMEQAVQNFMDTHNQTVDKEEKEPEIETLLSESDLPLAMVKKFRRAAKGKGKEISVTKKEVKLLLTKGVVGMVSAGVNPADAEDMKLTPVQVKQRHEALKKDLIEKGLKFREVLGKYGEEEDSFMVFVTDVKRKELTDLGTKYNQDSIVYSDHDKNEMIFTTGENKGKRHKGNGFEMLSKSTDDFFTEIDTDKGKVKFSLNFNFDEIVKALQNLMIK